MAALAKTAVHLNARMTYTQAAARNLIARDFTLTLTGQGTVANSIDATTLGLTKIIDCGNATSTDNTLIIVASPSQDGTKLLLKAAGTNAPADYTGTFRITVYAK